MPRKSHRPLTEFAIERQGRVLLLAYDQGLEYGPTEFNDASVDPSYVLDIAEHGQFTGIVLQKGVAAAYYQPTKHTIPLLVKLNGHSKLAGNDSYAPIICTVDEAVGLGAKAVGYTLYLGSAHEGKMMAELAEVVRDARERGVAVMAWMNLQSVRADDQHRDILAYAGRIALELGADYVQLQYAESVADYAWVVESAGRCKVVSPGGPQADIHSTVKLARSVLQAGGVGLIVGKRVWRADDPLVVAQSIRSVLWKDKETHANI